MEKEEKQSSGFTEMEVIILVISLMGNKTHLEVTAWIVSAIYWRKNDSLGLPTQYAV